jgi:hypothetical protein
MRTISLTWGRLRGRICRRNDRRLVVADDGFHRADGKDGALLATNGEGNRTKGHGDDFLKQLRSSEESFLRETLFKKRKHQYGIKTQKKADQPEQLL